MIWAPPDARRGVISSDMGTGASTRRIVLPESGAPSTWAEIWTTVSVVTAAVFTVKPTAVEATATKRGDGTEATSGWLLTSSIVAPLAATPGNVTCPVTVPVAPMISPALKVTLNAGAGVLGRPGGITS